MCGRFAVGDPEVAAWEGWLEAPMPDADARPAPSWNVAPTDPALILALDREGARRIRTARWGLVPHWWKKPLAEMKAATFNARSEEAAEKPMFWTAWQHARCLVPALGYYEWTGKAGAKQPWFISMERNTPGICFAGLWARAEVDGALLESFTILTCPAGTATRDLHPRQPVILAEAAWADWLAEGDPEGRLMQAQAQERITWQMVDRAVGNTRNDGPELIEPIGLGL